VRTAGRRTWLGAPADCEPLRAELEAAAARAASGGRFVPCGSGRAYLKHGPLRGKARLRHGLRGALGLPLPRLAEYANLTWLREHGFGAPRPLAALAVHRRGLPVFQALATEEVPGARTLRSFLEEGHEGRADVLRTLGREVGRLHARGFVHRDLFPRNVLVTLEADAPRLSFLDAWRGGPGRGLRGPTYDVACLFLYAPALLERDEEALLLDAYLESRSRAGESLDARRLLADATRQRRRLVARLERRGRTTPPLPPRDWSPPSG
jgi:tRNA A-37 threonylcarbamoyl transferase component Bud32